MSILLNPSEIEILRESALLVGKTLAEAAKMLRPGLATKDIDKMAEEFLADHGAKPSFKGYGDKSNPFPFSLCISVNEEVVHGLPSDYELKETDIVSIDCGAYKNGYHGDHAYTFALAGASDEAMELIRVTKESLYLGIEQARAGLRTGDIGYAVEHHAATKHKYGVVKELVGHGVGRNMHEDPQVPNYGRRGSGKKLLENMVLAIEPMITMGKRHIEFLDDGWSIVTADGKPAAHFEHNVWVKKSGPELLSDYAPIEAAEKANSNLRSDYY